MGEVCHEEVPGEEGSREAEVGDDQGDEWGDEGVGNDACGDRTPIEEGCVGN